MQKYQVQILKNRNNVAVKGPLGTKYTKYDNPIHTGTTRVPQHMGIVNQEFDGSQKCLVGKNSHMSISSLLLNLENLVLCCDMLETNISTRVLNVFAILRFLDH